MTVKIEMQKCLRCNYEWYPKSPNKPVVCAHCRSKYWDKPYTRKVKKNVPEVAKSTQLETLERKFIFGSKN